MQWPQTDAESEAVQSVLDQVLEDLEQLEIEEKLLRERLDALSVQRSEAEATISYLRKRRKALPPHARDETMHDHGTATAAGPPAHTEPLEPNLSTGLTPLAAAAQTPEPGPEATPHPGSAQVPEPRKPDHSYPSNTLRSRSGQTRYDLARSLLVTSEHGLTTTMLAQVFDETDSPSRGRVEGARITLVKLVDEGVAERIDRNLYIAKRVQPGGPEPALKGAAPL